MVSSTLLCACCHHLHHQPSSPGTPGQCAPAPRRHTCTHACTQAPKHTKPLPTWDNWPVCSSASYRHARTHARMPKAPKHTTTFPLLSSYLGQSAIEQQLLAGTHARMHASTKRRLTPSSPLLSPGTIGRCAAAPALKGAPQTPSRT